MKSIYIKIAGAISLLFGLTTIFEGGSVILDLFGLRADHPHYVSFVLWANFLCGFLYVIAGFGFFMKRKFTSPVLLLALIILILTFIGFVIWISSGRPYDTQTLVAMSARTVVTIILFLLARKFVKEMKPVTKA
ncbi:MAG: hypothetical protein J0H55_12850 [Chitinophagaceae bacterium]|nr:hypothetical protein [Chitinophagaceae bacterium]